MGFWSALTFQGKLAVAAVILVSLTLIGYLYGDDNPGQTGALNDPGFVIPTQAQAAGATTTTASGIPIQQQTPVTQATQQASGNLTATPAASPTGAAATATQGVAEPTATQAPPTATVPAAPTAVPTPEPPPPTPEPTCVVSASVSPGGAGGRDTASGQVRCGGNPQAGATMNAVFRYNTSAVGCGGTADGAGSASCGVNRPQDANLISVEVCFASNGTYCAVATP